MNQIGRALITTTKIAFATAMCCAAAKAQITQKSPEERAMEINQKVENGISAQDLIAYKKAVDVWRPLAEAGHAGSQFELGSAYSNGFGTDHSLEKAAFWLRKAATQNYIEAQLGLVQINKIDRTIVSDEEKGMWERRLKNKSASNLEILARDSAFSK